MSAYLNRANDEQLVSYYISGEGEALEVLIGRYQQKIFSYILTIVHDKDLAEDLFQDTFIKVIHTLRAGNYKEEGKFNQWIMRITRNLIIDYFRKNQKMAYVENNNKTDIFEFFPDFVIHLVHAVFHRLEKKILLVLEIAVERPFADTGILSDIVDVGNVKTGRGETLDCRFQYFKLPLDLVFCHFEKHCKPRISIRSSFTK